MNIHKLKNSYEKNEINKQDFIKCMYGFHQILFDYSAFLSDTDIKSIEISDNRVLMIDKNFDIKIICPPHDLRVVPIETLNFKRYEETELRLVLDCLKEDSVVLDIGANIGWYSLVIGKMFPSAEIYAFEPLQHIFDYLASHIEINKIKNIKALNLGVSDAEGQSNFYVGHDNSVNASMRNVANSESVQQVNIDVTTLDKFVNENVLKKVDFIKCDVEGAELQVLKGASKTLKTYRPIILCEMVRKWTAPFGYHPNDIIYYLKEYEYLCFAINKEGLTQIACMDEEMVETNFLFMTKSQANNLGL